MRVPTITAELAWIIGGQFVATIGSLVGVRLLTSVVAPAIYGEIAIGMTVASLITQLLTAPLINSAARYFAPAREDGSLASFFATLRAAYIAIVGIAIVLLACGGIVVWKVGYAQYIPIACCAVAFSLIAGTNSTFDSIQNASRHRVVVAWHQAAATWGRFLFAVALVLTFRPSSVVVFCGYIVGTFLVMCSQYIFFNHLIRPSITKQSPRKWMNQIITYGSPFAAWGIFTWAQAASDRWALTIYDTRSDVGRYAVLFQIGYYPISIIAGIIMQLMMPIMFERAGDGTDPERLIAVYRLVKTISIGILGAGVLLAISSVIAGRFIVSMLVAPEYRSIYKYLPFMAAAGCVFFAAQFLGLALMSSNKSSRQISSKVGVAVFAVISNLVLASLLGVQGVVYANIISSSVFLCWTLWLVLDEERALIGAHRAHRSSGSAQPEQNVQSLIGND